MSEPTLHRVLLAALACGLACTHPPLGRQPAQLSAASARAAPGIPLLLRGGALFDAPGGKAIGDLWDPTKVELLADGRVRGLDPVGNEVVGYPPHDEGGLPSRLKGLGGYAVAAAPLLLSPGGPAIGQVLPGAFLPVVGARGALVEVLVQGFGHPAMPARRPSDPLHALVPASALGPAEPKSEPPRPVGAAFYDHQRRLQLSPAKGAAVFAQTRCGELRVVETRKDAATGAELQQLAQVHEGVELRGWTDEPIVAVRGGFHCPARVIARALSLNEQGGEAIAGADLGEGYARPLPENVLAPRLTELLEKDPVFHIPVVEGEQAVCEAFRSKGWRLSPEGKRAAGKPPLRPRRVHLSGVSLTLDPGSRQRASYRVVDLDRKRLVLLPLEQLSSHERDFEAYHRDDAESWFLDAGACARHASGKTAWQQ